MLVPDLDNRERSVEPLTAAPVEKAPRQSLVKRVTSTLLSPLSELVGVSRDNKDKAKGEDRSNKIAEDLKNAQPGYFRSSVDTFVKVFKNNPFWTAGYASTYVAEAVLQIAPLVFLTQLTSQLYNKAPPGNIGITCACLAGCWVLRHIVDAFRPWLSHGFRTSASRTLENDLLKDITSRSQSTISSPGFSDVLTNVRENFWRSVNFIDRNMAMCSSVLACGLATLAIVKTAPLVALAFAGIGVLELFNGIRSTKRFETTEDNIAETRRRYWYERYYAMFKDGIREFKNLIKSKESIDRVDGLDREMNTKVLRDSRKQAVNSALIGVLSVGTKVGLVASLVSQYFAGSIQDPSIIQSVLFMAYAFEASLASLFKMVGDQQKDLSYTSKILAMGMVGKPDRDPNKEYVRIDRKVAPRIDITDVHYIVEEGLKPILKGINMTLEPGKIYGVCGDSGAGKSTLIKLLTLENEVSAGKITLAGHDLSDVDPDDVRAVIGYLPQQYLNLDAYTVREAVKLSGRPGETSVSFDDAADRANLKFLGDRYADAEKRLGTEFKGSRDFSGGERQRIALCRTYFKDAQVLILDEPTAQLGVADEEKIIPILQAWARENDRTVILISHRYANLQGAEKIFFFRDGEILENGSHQELLLKGGEYARRFAMESAVYISQKDVTSQQPEFDYPPEGMGI